MLEYWNEALSTLHSSILPSFQLYILKFSCESCSKINIFVQKRAKAIPIPHLFFNYSAFERTEIAPQSARHQDWRAAYGRQ